MKNLMEKNKVLFVAIAFAAISLALVLYIANIWQGFHYLMGVFSPI
ncbi:AI-2E family transporter, partial [Streptococcus danieliae]|nr:AI-2E family transporter [Streptococcus danieliae]